MEMIKSLSRQEASNSVIKETTCHKSYFIRQFTGKMPDPNPTTPVLCEPAQSTCTLDMSQEPFSTEVYRKNAGPQSCDGDTSFARACAIMHMDMSQDLFRTEIYKKNIPDPNPTTATATPGTCVLRELAQSTLTLHMHTDISQEPFRMEILNLNDSCQTCMKTP